MAGFTKLFSSIVDSTIWREEMHIKVVWVTMLAKADRNGFISSSLPGLADAARVTIPQCEDALRVLTSPDPYSRTKDFDGRRAMVTDGGWILLNYLKYRKVQDEDEVRIATAERVRKHREKYSVTNVTDVTPSNAIAEAEAEATLPPTPSRGRKPPRKRGLPDWDSSLDWVIRSTIENKPGILDFWPKHREFDGTVSKVSMMSGPQLKARLLRLASEKGTNILALRYSGWLYFKSLRSEEIWNGDEGRMVLAHHAARNMDRFYGLKDGGDMWESNREAAEAAVEKAQQLAIGAQNG